jgi:hypothetical protein
MRNGDFLRNIVRYLKDTPCSTEEVAQQFERALTAAEINTSADLHDSLLGVYSGLTKGRAVRSVEIDFNDPVNGRKAHLSSEAIVRILVENGALAFLEGHKKVRKGPNAGHLQMVARPEEWYDRTRGCVFFHRPYYVGWSEAGITLHEILEKDGWTILERDLDKE